MGRVKVYELKAKVVLLKDLTDDKLLTVESDFIDSALAKDPYWFEFHKKNQYKHYTFDKLKPFMGNAVYTNDNVYTIVIRSVNESLIKYLCETLKDNSNDTFKGVSTNLHIVKKRKIRDLYTLTPVIMKYESGYWRTQEGLNQFEKDLFANAVKKYNDFTGEKINENFDLYNSIEIRNKYPISNKYKNITLLGDKIHLLISDDPMSQELAYFLSGVGVGTCCSRGFGFCNFDWV